MLPLPHGSFRRVRAKIMAWCGFDVGHAVLVTGRPSITGSRATDRLHLGDRVEIGIGCLFDLADSITIERGAVLGPNIAIMTGTHQLASASCRAGELRASPIVIGSGVWIGTGCTILAGVTIGSGAVVAAGAVVTKSVPSNSMVAGVPARVIRAFDESGVVN